METTLEYPVITMQAWRLVNDVIDKLNNREIIKETIIEISIKEAVKNNVSPAEIIDYLQRLIEGNYVMVADLIGNELTDKIKSFK